MHHVLLLAVLVVAAVATITLSPFGRRTLGEVGRDGMTLRHARHLVHVMLVIGLMAAVAAAVSPH